MRWRGTTNFTNGHEYQQGANFGRLIQLVSGRVLPHHFIRAYSSDSWSAILFLRINLSEEEMAGGHSSQRGDFFADSTKGANCGGRVLKVKLSCWGGVVLVT